VNATGLVRTDLVAELGLAGGRGAGVGLQDLDYRAALGGVAVAGWCFYFGHSGASLWLHLSQIKDSYN